MKLFNKNIICAFFKTNYCLVFILSLLVAVDTFTKFYLNSNMNFSWAGKVIISILLFACLYLFNKRIFVLVAILFWMISFGMALNFQNDFIEKVSLFFEYVSGIMFFNFLIVNNNKNLLFKILLIIFTFYTVTVLTAWLFEIDYLRTYNALRFGYMPLFSSQNEFSFIMIAIVVFYYKNWLRKKKFYSFLLLFLSLAASLIIGTKVIYIFLIVFVNCILILNFHFKKIILFYVLLIITLFYFKDYLFLFLENKFEIFVDLYHEKGLLDTISSLRVSFLQDRLICQTSNMNHVEYLFGGMTIPCLTEMSFFDIFLFFGCVGGFMYCYLYLKLVLKKLSLDLFGLVFISTITTLSMLAGYYFENFSSQIYTISVLFIFYYKPTITPSQNTNKKV